MKFDYDIAERSQIVKAESTVPFIFCVSFYSIENSNLHVISHVRADRSTVSSTENRKKRSQGTVAYRPCALEEGRRRTASFDGRRQQRTARLRAGASQPRRLHGAVLMSAAKGILGCIE